ncbi:MAG: xanthine dehydrogenase family protein, partial [Proteobacteria bacterium]|nr:xanthine dehydrogenase family protein [Pseudomonadota bacterium]
MHARFRHVSHKRRTKEDRRFITGQGSFVADIALPGTLHVALVTSPYPCAEIRAIHTTDAMAVDGVVYVITGDELVDATNPLLSGLDLPNILRRPMAAGVARYAGEWVAAVAAQSRHIAEDAAELIEVDYEAKPFVVDAEKAIEPDAPLVHPDHGSNIIYQRKFTWGDVDGDFAKADHELSFRACWGRNSTVPIETFGVIARWNPGLEMLEVWASIQMPKYAEQIARALGLAANCVRVHYDVDVGGSYGVKRGIKHTVLVGYLARKLAAPVRLIEDRLENMTGGDAHGPDRIFDVSIAFDNDGTLKSLRIRALDNVGCYPGRAPLQLGKPIGAIVGPYRIQSVEYEPISVCTNITSQEAVRGFGQGPANFAIETAVDKVARHLGMDRVELRKLNFIAKDEFPYTIPSGTAYDSGDYHTVTDKTLALADYPALVARRDALRAEGKLAGIGFSACLEPSGGNAGFEPLFNPNNPTTTWMESCQIKIDLMGGVTAIIATQSAGQGHETLVATVIGEELERDPDDIRVVRADSLALPSNSPVGSRMAIMMGGAASGAAKLIRERVIEIAAHNFQLPADRLIYPGRRLGRRRCGQGDDLGRAGGYGAPQVPPNAPGLGAGAAGELYLGGADRWRPARRR